MRQVGHESSATHPWSRHDRSSQQPWLGSQASISWAIRDGLELGEGAVSVVADCGGEHEMRIRKREGQWGLQGVLVF
jgi:hypothetical protein